MRRLYAPPYARLNHILRVLTTAHTAAAVLVLVFFNIDFWYLPLPVQYLLMLGALVCAFVGLLSVFTIPLTVLLLLGRVAEAFRPGASRADTRGALVAAGLIVLHIVLACIGWPLLGDMFI